MKLELINFRCHEKSIFDFHTKGVTLLSGTSGTGKTSILLGIQFALYGTGHKVIMDGKTTCSVLLEIEDLCIKRSKKPNRLIVNDNYEDDVAQEIINKKFGTNFDKIGYIAQNNKDTFLLQSPSDKLLFIEHIAFKDINMIDLKTKCKNNIQLKHEVLKKCTTKLEYAHNIVNELILPETQLFPIKCNVSKRPIIIKNENTRLKNNNILKGRAQSTIIEAEKELKKLEILNARTTSNNESIHNIRLKIKKLVCEKKKIDYIGDDKLKEYEDLLLTIISNREYTSMLNSFQSDMTNLQLLKKNEEISIQDKINTITNLLWNNKSKDECISLISEYTDTYNDSKQLAILNDNLTKYQIDTADYNSTIEELHTLQQLLVDKNKIKSKLELQKNVFTCPNCSTNLKLQNNILCTITTDFIEEDMDEIQDTITNMNTKIQKLQKKIINVENNKKRWTELNKDKVYIKNKYNSKHKDNELPSITEIKESLTSITNYYENGVRLEKELIHNQSLLNNNIYSDSLQHLIKKLETQQLHINKLLLVINTDCSDTFKNMNEEEVRQIINKQQQNKIQLHSINAQLHSLNDDKIKYTSQNTILLQNHQTEYNDVHTIEDITNKLTELKNNIKIYDELHIEITNNLQLINTFLEYEKELNIYNVAVEKMNVLKMEEKECQIEYESVLLLKEKIIEAESIAMSYIILSINTTARLYLDLFFIDNPISVLLVPFKETKTGKKSQLNIEIMYKSMKCDINMLSGGELCRVILAFTLAFSELFNIPVILLDECTAALDQELTNVVIDGIKENFMNKLVVIIAHQTIKGNFDHIIEI